MTIRDRLYNVISPWNSPSWEMKDIEKVEANLKVAIQKMKDEVYIAQGIPVGPTLTKELLKELKDTIIKQTEASYQGLNYSFTPQYPPNYITATMSIPLYTCPLCGSDMISKEGKFGLFYSCKNWKKKGCPATLDANGKPSKKTKELLLTKKKTEAVKKKQIEKGVNSDPLLDRLDSLELGK